MSGGAPSSAPAPRADASESDSVAGGSALLFAGQVAGNAGFFVAVLVLARALGPAGRGTTAFVTVTALVLARVARLGVHEATTVFAAQRPRSRSVLLSNVVLISAVAALVGAGVVCGVLLLAEQARPAGVGRVELALLGLGTMAAALAQAGHAFLLGCSRFHAFALLTGAMPWIYAGWLAAVWGAAGLTVARALSAWAGAHGLLAVGLFVAALRGIGLARPNRSLIGESIAFGLRAWVGSLATFLNFRADQILMGFIVSEATLGVYAVAVNASEVLLYLPVATTTALVPVIARSDPFTRGERTLGVFRSLALISGVGVGVAALAGPALLPVVFGDAFEASVVPFLCLLPAALGFVAVALFSNALMASSSPGLSSLGPLTALVLGLGLDLALIPPFGAEGAAVAASAALLVGGGVAIFAYRSQSPFAWHALVPGRRDVEAISGFLRPLLARARGRRASM